MFDFVWNLSSFIIALGILITVHEYGHFWVARKNGVRVERFSIGFGKALWRRTDRLGTEYVIALIPLGGYVKMLDERVDTVAPEDLESAFNQKSVYQRIAIIAAGPFANFIFAIFAFWLMFLIGIPALKPIIGDISPASIAAKAGLTPNSEIVEIDQIRTSTWQDVNLALVSKIGDDSIEVKFKAIDSQYVKTVQLDTGAWQFSPDKDSSIESLGILPYRPKIFTEIAAIEANSPADKAGLRVGDSLLAINGNDINADWQVFSQSIREFPNTKVTLAILRAGQRLTIEALPASVVRNGEAVGYLGIVPKQEAYPEQFKMMLSYGPIDALTEGTVRTWKLVVLSFDMIGKLITGDVSVKNLSGPISIAQGAGDHAGYGLVYFLGFLALISVNLGIINLLPMPVLDGGHLLYYLVELVTGKPVSEKVQEIGFKIGAIALLILMGIALFNDLSRF